MDKVKVSLICVLGQFANYAVCLYRNAHADGLLNPCPEGLESAIITLHEKCRNYFVDGWEHLPLFACTQSELERLLKVTFVAVPEIARWKSDICLESLAWNVSQAVFELSRDEDTND